jgi:hypothetical protein
MILRPDFPASPYFPILPDLSILVEKIEVMKPLAATENKGAVSGRIYVLWFISNARTFQFSGLEDSRLTIC